MDWWDIGGFVLIAAFAIPLMLIFGFFGFIFVMALYEGYLSRFRFSLTAPHFQSRKHVKERIEDPDFGWLEGDVYEFKGGMQAEVVWSPVAGAPEPTPIYEGTSAGVSPQQRAL